MEVQPLPSLSTIGRILRRRELTHRRTGRYAPKGKKYPELPALLPNQTHQVDLVGPCYLTGPIRFYSLHAVDTAINRCGIEPMPSKGGAKRFRRCLCGLAAYGHPGEPPGGQ